MEPVKRLLSRPQNRPYRTKELETPQAPYLDEDGHVGFAPGDIENPYNWSIGRRVMVTAAAVLLVLNATFASSSPSGTIVSISKHFHVSNVAGGLTITLFLLGYCAGPLVWAPLSEFYGRRWIFYISFSLYVAFNFLCAWPPNFGSLLVGRFLTGTFVSAPLTNAPGVLVDLWGPLQRGNAMAGFACFLWIGPALGPVVSGFLEITEDWRWSFYVLLWLGGATAVLMLTIPETYGPTILVHKARRIRAARIPGYEDVKAPLEDTDRSLLQTYKIALTRPWVILFDTISLLCAIYLSVVYTLLYMLFSIYPIVFQRNRGWNPGVGELPLIGTAIGALFGGLIVVFDTRRQAKHIKAGRTPEPEDRLFLAMIGGVGFAVSIFWFAWTAEYNSIHWIVPTIAGGFLSTSMLLIFVSFLNYIVDAYLMYAASALAANTIARSACGASAPLFTNQMFTAVGVGAGGSIIGGVSAALAIIPFLFYKYGKAIRIRSKFAPTKTKDEGRARANKDEERGNDESALQGPQQGQNSGGLPAHDSDESTVVETRETGRNRPRASSPPRS